MIRGDPASRVTCTRSALPCCIVPVIATSVTVTTISGFVCTRRSAACEDSFRDLEAIAFMADSIELFVRVWCVCAPAGGARPRCGCVRALYLPLFIRCGLPHAAARAMAAHWPLPRVLYYYTSYCQRKYMYMMHMHMHMHMKR